MPRPNTFLALDLEHNKLTQSIIQVGIALGRPDQDDAALLVRQWKLRVDEVIDPSIVALTGIDNETLEREGVTPAQCAHELHELLVAGEPFTNPVVWGADDSKNLLRLFARLLIAFPHFGHRCIDVKTWTTCLAFSRPGGNRSVRGGLARVMQRYGLAFLGTPHRADVDAFNTLRFFFHLLRRQQVLEQHAPTATPQR